jgi:hypothetical protein
MDLFLFCLIGMVACLLLIMLGLWLVDIAKIMPYDILDVAKISPYDIADVAKIIPYDLVLEPPADWTEDFSGSWKDDWGGFVYTSATGTDRSAVFTSDAYGCKMLPTAINQICSAGYVDLGAEPTKIKMVFKYEGEYIGVGVGGAISGDDDYEGGGGVWMAPSDRLYNGGFLATGAPDVTDYSAMTLVADTEYYVIIDYTSAGGDMTEVSTVYRASDDNVMATNTRVYASYSWTDNLHLAVRDNTETAHYVKSIEVWF